MMNEGFGSRLDEIEKILDAIASAFDCNDLMLAGALNVELDSRLHACAEALGAAAAAGSGQAVGIAAGRLREVLDRQRGFVERLCELRDGIGVELSRLRRGRRGAAEFLEAAGA